MPFLDSMAIVLEGICILIGLRFVILSYVVKFNEEKAKKRIRLIGWVVLTGSLIVLIQDLL